MAATQGNRAQLTPLTGDPHPHTHQGPHVDHSVHALRSGNSHGERKSALTALAPHPHGSTNLRAGRLVRRASNAHALLGVHRGTTWKVKPGALRRTFTGIMLHEPTVAATRAMFDAINSTDSANNVEALVHARVAGNLDLQVTHTRTHAHTHARTQRSAARYTAARH